MGRYRKSIHHRARNRQGMFVLDALLGLVMIVAIAGALGAVTSARQRAAIRTAQIRAADRAAENALTLLQTDQPAPADVSIKRLDFAAPATWMWVEATSRIGDRTAVVSGLAPATGGSQ